MKRYRTEFAPGARAAIRAHADYIAFDLGSPENAERWLLRLFDAIAGLEEWPSRFSREDDQSLLHGTTIHRLVFERSYVLLYSVDESKSLVRIVSFRHGGHA